MKTLDLTLKSLEASPDVDAVFLTGSQGADRKPHSDIDLIVILAKNDHGLKSIYTWIDGTFADIFFFDQADLDRLASAKDVSANTLDGVLVGWLEKATVQFDKSGKLSAMKARAAELNATLSIPEAEKRLFWDKVNYNLVANTRYFESNDPAYHEALDMRLLYSTSDVFTAYFVLRNIPWRGEKSAFKYLKGNDLRFYETFQKFSQANELSERFAAYVDLSRQSLVSEYGLWRKDVPTINIKDRTAGRNDQELEAYWKELIGEK